SARTEPLQSRVRLQLLPTYLRPAGNISAGAGVCDSELEHRDQTLQLRQHALVRNDCAAADVARSHRNQARLDRAFGACRGSECAARQAQYASAARYDASGDARVDTARGQRHCRDRSSDACQDHVLSGRHVASIPSGALNMKNANPGRRAFLRNVGAMSAFGLASRLDFVNLIAEARAQNAPDYKALVCVFMFGGNDGNNTVIPIDAAGYGQYAAARPASSGINLAQASLLPIEPVNLGMPFGLHSALPELQTL